MENNKKNIKIIDANCYIKNSSVYSNSRYQWLKYLIDKVLTDKLTGEDIPEYLNRILSIKEDISKIEDDSQEVIELSPQSTKGEIINIDQIKSILKIKNIGLLDIEEPITFKPGLNVCYGKNGSGKSSIYLALCKTLGLGKNIITNINSNEENCCCSIVIKDTLGEEKDLELHRIESNQTRNVKLFDSEISQFLVEKDQINHFEITHLKSEYFTFLHHMFDDVFSELQKKLESVTSKIDSEKKIIEANIPSFFIECTVIPEVDFLKISFADSDQKILNKIEAKIKTLEKHEVEAIIKNLNTAKSHIHSFLNLFGTLDINKTSDDKDEEKETWSFEYTLDYFESINSLIDQYNSAKKAFEESSNDKLTKIIPEDWIKQNKWNDFIKSSIIFLNSLEENEKKNYIEDTCVYCHQPLKTVEAKELIKIYHEIQKEHENKLKSLSIDLENISKKLGLIVLFLDEIPLYNKIIEKEFDTLGRSGKIDLELEKLKNILKNIKTSIDNYSKISIDETEIFLLENIWEYYLELNDDFIKIIAGLNRSFNDKQKIINDLKRKALPLQAKRNLVKNSESIKKYFEYNKLIDNIKEKLNDISAIRQAYSRLATSFSQEIPLEIFKNNLIKEYNNFNFIPPEVWNLNTITRGEENRRVYSLKDKRISEIFSEGERKIHALADFLALCKTNNFKGVYIFDDPANSLDDDNIEVVSKRILKLVEEGNQVIVFTHNLFFLYSLLEHNYNNEKITKLTRLSNSIYLEREVQVGSNNELKKVYEEIERRLKLLSEKNEQDISEYELKEIYNIMSGYLESFVEVVLFKEVVTRYRPNIRMNSLDRVKEIDLSIIDDLMNLYNHTSRKCSRHSHPVPVPSPKYNELLNDFKHLRDKYSYK
jgi:predicted ATPase